MAEGIEQDSRVDLVAATPPLEAKRLLFSWAATEVVGYIEGEKKEGMKMDFLDVRRAYLHVPAVRR